MLHARTHTQMKIQQQRKRKRQRKQQQQQNGTVPDSASQSYRNLTSFVSYINDGGDAGKDDDSSGRGGTSRHLYLGGGSSSVTCTGSCNSASSSATTSTTSSFHALAHSHDPDDSKNMWVSKVKRKVLRWGGITEIRYACTTS